MRGQSEDAEQKFKAQLLRQEREDRERFLSILRKLADFLDYVQSEYAPEPGSTLYSLVTLVPQFTTLIRHESVKNKISLAYAVHHLEEVNWDIQEFGREFTRARNPDPQRYLLRIIRTLNETLTSPVQVTIEIEQLDNEQVSGILSTLQKLMERVVGIAKPIQPKVPGETPAPLKLHEALTNAGVYAVLTQRDQERGVKDPTRRAKMLQTYLTTETTIAGLQTVSGLSSRSRNHELLHSAMQDAYPLLPEPDRQQYEDAGEALRTRSGIQTDTSITRIKESLAQGIDPTTGKIKFSDTHITHISDAASRRWKRQREMQQQDTNGNTPT